MQLFKFSFTCTYICTLVNYWDTRYLLQYRQFYRFEYFQNCIVCRKCSKKLYKYKSLHNRTIKIFLWYKKIYSLKIETFTTILKFNVILSPYWVTTSTESLTNIFFRLKFRNLYSFIIRVITLKKKFDRSN